MPRSRILPALVSIVALACSGEAPDERFDPASEPAADSAVHPLPTPPADSSNPSPDPSAPPDTARPASEIWTTGIIERPSQVQASNGIPVITALRTALQPDFDRVTLEFSGPALPGYHVSYVDKPLHDCGSGEQVFPVGDAWLQIRLEPANAHTEAGAPTIGARQIEAKGTWLRRIYRTCDFEAVVVLTLAVEKPNDFRVFTLKDPTRIVIDVKR